MSEFYAPVDPDLLRRERAKARELRASQWWKRRIADGVCYYCRRRVPSCKECNTNKKALVPLEWQAYLERLHDSSTD